MLKTVLPVRQLAALKMNPDFLNRDVNANFSGGEKKRNEILQLSVLEASLLAVSICVSAQRCLYRHLLQDPSEAADSALECSVVWKREVSCNAVIFVVS